MTETSKRIAHINKALNQVGPIPGGKEVVVQYTSDIISDGKFYTGVLILAMFLLFAVFQVRRGPCLVCTPYSTQCIRSSTRPANFLEWTVLAFEFRFQWTTDHRKKKKGGSS